MKYLLISRTDEESLSNNVNNFLNDGWQLHGSPNVSLNRNGVVIYIQAITKKSN